MKPVLTIIAALLLVSTFTPPSVAQWNKHSLSSSFSSANGVYAADLDGDGDVDILGSAIDANEVSWWENDEHQAFTKHIIDGSFTGAISVSCVDMDDDGDMDIVAAAFGGNAVAWWENNGTQSFTKHIIDSNIVGPGRVYPKDMDSDGDMDVVVSAFGDNSIDWYENDGHQSFTKHLIEGNYLAAFDAYPIDMDGDSDVDVAGSAGSGSTIDWWENNGDQIFTRHIIAHIVDGPRHLFAADIDGDSDVDVLGTEASGQKISWWENDGSQHFTQHLLDGDFGPAFAVYAADLNKDGQMDIIGASIAPGALAWWENNGNQTFAKHAIDNGFGGANSIHTSDIDGDGDLDVLATGEFSNQIAWFENPLYASRTTLAPMAIDFGGIQVGRSSDTVAVTVRNESLQPLIINSISRSQTAFSLLNLPAFPATLAPSDSIRFGVYFRPTTRGVANGMIVVANSDTLNPNAAVALQGNGILLGPQFQTFVTRVNAAPYPEQAAIVDSFLTAHSTVPLTEQDSICQFIYRGNATSVNVPGDANEWNASEFPMVHLSSTDLWYWPSVFEPDARLDYKFVLDGSSWILDPRNPHQILGGFGPNSELRMPSYVPAPEIEYYPQIPHGILWDTTYTSINLPGNPRPIRVYTPPGYETSTDSFPVILLHDGIEYVTFAQANNVLDYLISQNRIRPTIGVFVPPVNRDDEYTGGSQNLYAAFIATELMPYIDARYRTQRRPAARATVGISNGGNIALWIAYNYPQVFENVGSHSGNIQPATSSAFQSGSLRSLKLYIDAGAYDLAGFLTLSRNFRQAIQSKGYNHRYNEWHEGHSWGNWRAHLDDALEFFFPGPAVSVVEHGTMPSAFQLMQNYPNPFNPVTKIQFSIVNSQLTILKVFDVLGREVRTLVNEELKPGSYEKTFDATGLSSGVYFYTLRSGGSVATKRLLLLK